MTDTTTHIIDNPRVRIGREYGDKQVSVTDSFAMNMEARLACAMVERWGMVAGAADGEDSTGRAKARLLTPGELVQRAFDTARITLQTAFDRDLIVLLPDPNEINAEKDEARGEARAVPA